jgi:hypothetical protein
MNKYNHRVLSENSNDLGFYLESNNTIKKISDLITNLLIGVRSDNRDIIVPDKTIYSVMSSVYENYIPNTSDIHSRYVVPKKDIIDHMKEIEKQTISIIVSDVRNNIGIEEASSKLSVWNTVLGDFNEHGLQAHQKIKLREKRPMPMLFNMNY